MSTTDTAPALTLIANRDEALWLESRRGLPTYVEVKAARTNPWLSGCPDVTVEVYAQAPVTTGQTNRLLDTKTVDLRDPWGWDEVWTPGTRNDCLGTTTLALGAYRGPVIFVLRNPRNQRELARSGAVNLAQLPQGAAEDEQPGWFEDVNNPFGQTAQHVRSLLTLGVIGLVAYAAITNGPPLIEALNSRRDP